MREYLNIPKYLRYFLLLATISHFKGRDYFISKEDFLVKVRNLGISAVVFHLPINGNLIWLSINRRKDLCVMAWSSEICDGEYSYTSTTFAFSDLQSCRCTISDAVGHLKIVRDRFGTGNTSYAKNKKAMLMALVF